MEGSRRPVAVRCTSWLAALAIVAVGCLRSPEEGSSRVHDEHAHGGGHGAVGRGHGERVSFDAAQRAEFGIEVAAAGPGSVARWLALPGEIAVHADRVAHLAPRVAGVAGEVIAALGDRVEAGQVLAIVESRELAEAKTAYLAARERVDLARATFRREEALRTKQISSEEDYLAARQVLAEARIALRSTAQQLHALGFDTKALGALSGAGASITRYPLRAPISGTIIAKHVVRGEVVGADAPVFTVANLREVWALLRGFQGDVAALRLGIPARVRARDAEIEGAGTIDYLSPVVDPATRTLEVRVTLANDDGRWRPGLFVSGEVEVADEPVALWVPASAVIEYERAPTVFVEGSEGFAPRAVTLGRSDGRGFEVLAGLTAGDRYAAAGVLTLKAELGKAALEGAGHAH